MEASKRWHDRRRKLCFPVTDSSLNFTRFLASIQKNDAVGGARVEKPCNVISKYLYSGNMDNYSKVFWGNYLNCLFTACSLRFYLKYRLT